MLLTVYHITVLIANTFYLCYNKKGDFMKIVICQIIALLCVFCAMFIMLPVFKGICHIGMLYPTAILIVIAILLCNPSLFESKYKAVAIIVSSLIGVAVIFIGTVMGAMAVSASDRPKDNANVTVVVLGCLVRGTSPSKMLNDRINAAYEYLTLNENAMCIASGGMGENEQISEAECIKNELVALGIAPNRIIIEDKSTSTAENIEFSAKIINDMGLPTDIAIASDNFHQLRAEIFAEKSGLNARSLGCKTVWYLSAGYWFREVAGVVVALI